MITKNLKIIFIFRLVIIQGNSLSSLMLQINARKVRIVNVHFTYRFIQFSPIKGSFGLYSTHLTLTALSVVLYSIKNLVTSPRSNMSIRMTVPKEEKRAKTI